MNEAAIAACSLFLTTVILCLILVPVLHRIDILSAITLVPLIFLFICFLSLTLEKYDFLWSFLKNTFPILVGVCAGTGIGCSILRQKGKTISFRNFLPKNMEEYMDYDDENDDEDPK